MHSIHSAAMRRALTALAVLLLLSGPLAYAGSLPGGAAPAGTKTLTFEDLMKFRAIEKPVIADDGKVVAYGLQPDRGDGEGVVHALATGKVVRIPRGGSPSIAHGGLFVAMTIKPAFVAAEKAGKDKPKPGMALVNVATGEVTTFENVEKFVFSEDGRWLAYTVSPTEKKDEKPAAGAAPAKKDEPAKKASAVLKLRNLATPNDLEVGPVSAFAFDPESGYLAYAASNEDGKGNGLYVRPLNVPAGSSATTVAVAQADKARYEGLTWAKTGHSLAFLAAAEKGNGATLWTWVPTPASGKAAVASSQAPKGWFLPLKNELAWSRDGKRLFFGFKSGIEDLGATKTEEPTPNPYDFAQILSKVELDVWHWKDPRIQTQQKIGWEREKDRTYRAVLHLESGRFVPLADLAMPDVRVPENAKVALGVSDVPYQRETTWGESFRDIYVVNLETGARKLAVRHLREQPALSPDGRWLAYYDAKQWHLYDVAAGTERVVSQSLGVVLDDEEHDTPDTAPAYGFGGWVDEGASFLVYDRYDIWQIPTAAGQPVNVTAKAGRAREITFRVVALDPETKSLNSKEPLLLTAYHNREKNWGFYAASFAKPGVEARVDEKKLFKFITKAKKADVVLYSREDYREFPDVWASDLAFKQPRKVSDANPQIADFAWGTAELVDYKSQDGVPLQGVLIKPANYQPGTRVPVITYFYERQSNRLYEFNEPVVNHRPSFPIYAANGYAIFLPDIVFTVGHPGQSIVKCLVPAVQKLVDMGVADPKKLGLHGHSWGGYGTAYVVTQTDMFAAAVTGAPVANMTSAYGGIRWESGVARQFQYEQTQSRIGGSLWEKRDLYIENSALFFADKIHTPLLIEHGDEDGAVPWYQGIELYLALRRLDKDCIFLQYRGEPHHLKKYPNKLDYSIKMLEYFDHYLKGAPAAEWIEKGVPYRGK